MVLKILGIIWIIAGLVALFIGVKAMHDEELKGLVKDHLEVMRDEFRIKREDCVCLLYVSFVLFGFVGVTLVVLRKIKNVIKGRSHEE